MEIAPWYVRLHPLQETLMNNPAKKPMTLDEFVAWEDQQPARHQFVNGVITMMTGGTAAHSLISVNVLSTLKQKLRGSPCRPHGSDLRVQIPATGNSRYPDVTVDCGKYDPKAKDAVEPTVVFEVLSDSTRWNDINLKVHDYASIASVDLYICISQDEPKLNVWARGESGKFEIEPDITDPQSMLDLKTLGLSLSLEEIYEGTELLPTGPRP
jgi:Uma2 family endonuclease